MNTYSPENTTVEKMPNQKNDNKKQVADFVNIFITQ